MSIDVLKFEEFLNEELNFTKFDNGVCRLNDRWFYYNPDDDIIYGCDERPVGDDKLFAFNPVSCTIILNGDEKQYDVNNPVCLIKYDQDKGEVSIYSEDTIEYLNNLGFKGTDITDMNSRYRLQDIFENDDDNKFILLYGDQMVASTFDVIEEN